MIPVPESGRHGESLSQEKKSVELLLDFITDYSLSQMVSKPTRNEHILDLTFTNNPDLITSTTCIPIPKFSDHNLVLHRSALSLSVSKDVSSDKCPDQREEISTFNFAKTDFDLLRQSLSQVDWINIFSLPLPLSERKAIFIDRIVKVAKTLNVPIKENIQKKMS